MKDSKITECADKYLTEMHKRVGAKYDYEACKKEDWFRSHKWTREQEMDFKAWLVGEIRKDFKMARKRAILEAEWFILDFGWVKK